MITLIFGLFKEYFLSFKTTFFIFKKQPKKWNSGQKGTFVFIPGFLDTWRPFENLGNCLNKLGYKVIFLNNINTLGTIESMVVESLQVLNSTSISNLYIVGHSKGGLTAKYLLDNYEEINKKCIKVFTVSTPWGGTIFGNFRFLNLFQLIPKSSLLNSCSLNSNSCKKIINIYPKFDNSVVPNSNLVLQGVKNIKTNDIGHTNILNSKELQSLILDNL